MTALIKRSETLDEYRKWKQKACLLGSMIGNVSRELLDFDRYVIGHIDENTTFQETAWDIGSHLYERVVEPFVYRMKPKYFFVSYLGEHAAELPGGCLSGLVIGGGVLALFTTGMLGLCAPWWAVGVCCLPSLIYLVQGIKSFGKAACIINSSQPDRHLRAKQELVRGCTCLLIALLMPVAFALVFPIELVRFLTRLVTTAIEAITMCALGHTVENMARAEIRL